MDMVFSNINFTWGIYEINKKDLMKINLPKIIILSTLVFILIIFFKGLDRNNTYNTQSLVGKKISNFKLKSIKDNTFIDEKILKNNNFTLINFWASWCGPCKLEHKYLMKLSKNSSSLKLLGINFKDKEKNALKFLLELGDPYYLVASDIDGRSSVQFGVYGIPETIIIDKNLKIIKKIIGPISEYDYKDILRITK
jgi:cytochrome c biogenesis protein CcmG/thiol:disulfide interchange protein DsbE